MGKKIFKKLILICFSLISLTGCSSNNNLVEIKDEDLIKEISCFTNYAGLGGAPDPGTSYCSFDDLIQGYSSDSKDKDKNKRSYTYSYSYLKEKEAEYYIVYLKKDIFLSLYENIMLSINEDNNRSLGLYSYSSNKNPMSDLKVYRAKSFEGIKFSSNNYYLASILKIIKIDLISNLSQKRDLNYLKEYLSPLYIELDDKNNIKKIHNNTYVFEGKRIATNYLLVEDATIYNSTYSILEDYYIYKHLFVVKKYQEEEVIVAERYLDFQGGIYDLFEEPVEISDGFYSPDLFGIYKDVFKEAFLGMTTELFKDVYYGENYGVYSLEILEKYMK